MGKKKKDKGNKPRMEQPKKGGRPFFAIVVAAAVVALVAGYFYFGNRGPQGFSSVEVKDVASLKGGETRPTLSPTLFVGQTAAAYKIAQEKPELLDAMYCYCYCQESLGHKSLLSCYVDQHAANCGICQDQAFYANSLYEQGQSLAKVRQAMDRKFWRPLR